MIYTTSPSNATIVWSLTDTQEMILRSLLSGPSYGAKVVEAISESSDFYLLLDLGYVYKMLNQLQAKQLIEVVSVEEGGRERNHHRKKHYCITDLGRAAIAYKDSFRERLSQGVPTEGEQEIAVT